MRRVLDYPLLADENIHPEVIAGLRARGKVISSVAAEGLVGQSDSQILRLAYSRGWVVVTHDRDFGSLVLQEGQPYVGIIYLRPGHILASFVLQILAAVDSLPRGLAPPFLLTAERRGEVIRIRRRSGE